MRSKIFYIVWILVGLLSFFFDWRVVGALDPVDYHALDGFMIFLTDFGLLFVTGAFLSVLFEEGKWNYLILLAIALFLTTEVAFGLKYVFQVPRPFEMFDLKQLSPALGFSFPSMHTAFVFAALPFFRFGRLKYLWGWWMVFAIMIAVSRLYVGVHHLSDAVWGAFLGFLIGDIVCWFEEEHNINDWFLWHIKDKFELRRQVMHLAVGVTIAFAVYLGLIGAKILFAALAFGAVLIVISKYIDLPIIRDILDFFERPHARRAFPGKGSFFLVMGSFLAVILFPYEIAIAAIIVMAVGDSVSNIIGRYFGEIDIPWNREKQLEGPLAAFVLAFLACLFVVDWQLALFGSAAAMAVETWDFNIGKIRIDDNLIVPLVAGVVMVMV